MKKNIGTLKSHICNSCSVLMNDPNKQVPKICLSCNKKSSILEDIVKMNTFQLFNLEPKYLIDKNYVFKEYIQLQKLVHPDLIMSLKDEEAIKEAERASSIISKSYNILLNNYERAKQLVRILNNISLFY